MDYELLEREFNKIVRGWPSGDDVVENGCINELLQAVAAQLKDKYIR